MQNIITENFNEILYATHNAIREGLKEYDIKKCDIVLPKDFIVETTYQGINIDKYYDVSYEITNEVLNYTLEKLMNYVIAPATYAILYNINSYFLNNNNIVMPIKESNINSTLYKDNIGVGISYTDNIFKIEVFCGHII